MIKKIFIIIIMAITTNLISAHCGGCGVGDEPTKKAKAHSHIETKIKSLTEELNLTKKQKKELKKILNARKKEIKEVRSKYRANIIEILDEEQQEKFNNEIEKSESCTMCALETENKD